MKINYIIILIVRIKCVYLFKLIVMISLSLKELNDLYYCVGMMSMRKDDYRMISDDELDGLLNLLRSEIDMKFEDEFGELYR